MTQEDKDLCKKCKHYWTDFIITPDKNYIAHCEVVDGKLNFKPLDDVVPYPCTKCPYNSFEEKENDTGR